MDSNAVDKEPKQDAGIQAELLRAALVTNIIQLGHDLPR
jgi:hypothetical protein